MSNCGSVTRTQYDAEVFLALSPELEVSPERLFQPSHSESGSSV